MNSNSLELFEKQQSQLLEHLVKNKKLEFVRDFLLSNVKFINVSSSNARLDIKLVEEKDGKIQVYYGQSHNKDQSATSTFKDIEEKIKELKEHHQTPIPKVTRQCIGKA